MLKRHLFASSLVLTSLLGDAWRNESAAAEPLRKPAPIVKKSTVVISLKPNVQMKSRVVRLGDIASLSGGDDALRASLTELDVNDPLTEGESVMIAQQQIEFRLRLAGFNLQQISLKGNSCRVSSGSNQPDRTVEQTLDQSSARQMPTRAQAISSAAAELDGSLEQEIVQAAKTCILSKLPWPVESVEIRLAQPVPPEIRQVESADGYTCTADLRANGNPTGRTVVRVVAKAPQKPAFDVSLVMEVRHFDLVALTTKSMDRGHVLTAADVYIDRRDVTELVDYCTTTKELIGMSLKKPIRALSPMRLNELETAKADSIVTVKRRQGVKLIARIGVVSVSANGEAQDDGKVGDIVRVRNLDSNTIVQGRITSTGEVEVTF